MAWARFSRWRVAGLLALLAALILCDPRTLAADTAADIVLGQFDFAHNGVNIVTDVGLWTPQAVAVDRSVTPNRLYVADSGNHRVLAWRSIAALQNGSPADLVFGQPDFLSWGAECDNSAVNGETLCFPSAVAVDGAGNLYVVDQGNNRVLEYNQPFITDTIPDMVFGQGGSFTTTGCNKGGKITASTLCDPIGVAADQPGNVYIADSSNSRVLEYDTPLINGVVADRVYGQNGSFTSGPCNGSGVGAVSLCTPGAVAVDGSGHLYIADAGNFRVLEYDTPLSSATADLVFGQFNSFTSNTSPCPSTPIAGALCTPSGLAVDAPGNLYISDRTFSRVQEYNTPVTTGITTPDVIFGQPGFNSGLCNNGGPGAGTMCLPSGIATDANNDLFLADFGNQRVLEYMQPLATNPPNTSAGLVLGQTTLTSNGVNAPKTNSLFFPDAVALDRSVSPNRLYAADTSNNRVLGWKNVEAFTNGAPANLVIGQADFQSTGCNQNQADTNGNSLPGANTLCGPGGVAVDSAGDVWVADSSNFRVLQYNVPFSSGMTSGQFASVVLGQHGSFTSRVNNLGGVSATSMSNPAGLTVDPLNALYVADPNNNRVLKFNNPSAADTAADVVFGQGGSFGGSRCNFGGTCPVTGCVPSGRSLCGPSAVAVDDSNVYIADTLNNRVLQYAAPVSKNPIATLVVGQANLTGSNCLTLCDPQGVALDASGNLFAADAFNNQIDAYKAPLGNNPPANLIIGSALCGQQQALADTLCGVSGLGFDSTGNLYTADTLDDRVLEFSPPVVPTPTPVPTPVPTPTQTARPTGTPTPRPGFPFISELPAVIQAGAGFTIKGGRFTGGSRVNFFVATAKGGVNTGPFTPISFALNQLKVAVPPNNLLGEGVVSVQVVNTDQGFAASNIALALLQGNPTLGIPSLTAINSFGISSDSISPDVAVAFVPTVVEQGSSVTLQGTGFDAVHGVAINLFCACGGGKVGPFFVSPSLNLTSTKAVFNLPSSGPQAPMTGPGSFVLSNKGADGNYATKSNAVSVPIGQAVQVTGVSQSARKVTVLGSGFSTLTVINFFNMKGGKEVNFGGLNSAGKPNIPLTVISQGEFTFTLPAGATPGQAYVQALNPPFVAFTSSGNVPEGAFVVH
jgi:hypothetical protein